MTRTLRMDRVIVEIFSDLDYREEDGTLVATINSADFAILRCSVTSIFRGGKEVTEVAENEIPRLAAKAGTTHEVKGEKFFFRTQKPSTEDPNSTVFYWYIGLGGHIAVITVFIDHQFAHDARARHLLACADLLVEKFRRAQ